MGTIAVGAVVLLAIGLAVRSIYRDKKSGKCCGGCSGCSGACHCTHRVTKA